MQLQSLTGLARTLACCLWVWSFAISNAAPAEGLKLLFLGDNGSHRPVDRFAELAPVLSTRGIELKYTDDVTHLNSETLAGFDGLVLYANINEISKDQADALLAFVATGKGFVPLHCATYCFRNDPRIVDLMGGQFLRHGGEVFSTLITEPSHPVMRGFAGFESWDETYVHHKHNTKNRTVLEVRKQGMQAAGNDIEPWTWIRTHDKGRVFYTAWGHDQRTWTQPGFHNLVERGIRWACGDDPAKAGPFHNKEGFDVPEMTSLPSDLKPFEYVEVGAKIPNYVPSNRWGVQAPPLTTMQRPLPAEESIRHFVTPQGFQLSIYATERFSDEETPPPYAGFVGKPIAMNWDERGRLWVCETVDYPNELMPENKGRDQIRICEDTTGDGQADKFTLFATGLSIPTAITFHRGSVIVQNGTETLWLKDDNGDDVADRREVIISNWQLVDTHGGVSHFRYGLDNWFWAMQGYNASEPIITATGEKQPGFRMGFWRFQLDHAEPPAVTRLEFIRSTDNNTWGLGLSEEGLVFGSTANRNPSTFMPIANRYYEQVLGWGPKQLETIADTYLFEPVTDRVRQVDQHGGYTAAAGHALYTARNYPQQWWNRTAFVCGPTGKLVGTFVLKDRGTGFESSSPMNLVASNDEWSAPIAAEVGPDGNVWILDWYNYIVQHNPTPQGFETGKGRAYESDLRDKKHGRIYRLLYGDDATKSFPRLFVSDSSELIAALSDDSMLVRLHAQRLLVERGQVDVLPQLMELIQRQQIDEIGLDVAAMHALGVLQGLGVFDDGNQRGQDVLSSALRHPTAGVRRLALQNLSKSKEMCELICALNLPQDPALQVQLAALLALADQSSSEAAGKLVAHEFMSSSVLQDQWLPDAVTSAAAAHVVPFLVYASRQASGQLSEKQRDILRIVSEHFSRSLPSEQQLEQVVNALAEGETQVAVAVLEGMSSGWQRTHQVTLGANLDAALIRLMEHVPVAAKGNVIRLGTSWGSQALEQHAAMIVSALLKIVADEKQGTPQRVTAARQLVEFRATDDDVVNQLVAHVGAQSSPEFTEGIMDALLASTAGNLGAALIDRMRAMTPTGKQAALRVILSRPTTTRVFLKGIEAGDVQLADLSLEQKRGLSEHPDQKIRQQALQLMKVGGGLPNPDRQKVVEQMRPLAHEQGDVELGKAVFVKHCSKCHKHGDIGETIGPNLTGMMVHPKEELLVHILDPSRSVEGNFRLYTVVTTEGRILSGMLAAETRTSIELIDTEAKRKTLARVDIEELLASPKSLMPEGFEKQATREEFRNLLEFLTNKGKYVPIDFTKIATIVSTKPMFYGTSPAERIVFADWKPKVFEGIPFLLVDPQGDRVPNVVMLFGPNGRFAPTMPNQVEFLVNAPAARIHVLGGVGGWSYPAESTKSVSVNMRLHYTDGETENLELRNGIEFADYIRRVDVPGSRFAYDLNGQQVRYFSVAPKRQLPVSRIELIKGEDRTAPIFVAITVETP